MNEQENTKTARRCYELFKADDIESLMDLYTDDAAWETPKTENMPQTGKRQGKQQILEFMLLVGEDENLHFEPREFVAQGDKVVVLGDYHCRCQRCLHRRASRVTNYKSKKRIILMAPPNRS